MRLQRMDLLIVRAYLVKEKLFCISNESSSTISGIPVVVALGNHDVNFIMFREHIYTLSAIETIEVETEKMENVGLFSGL